MEMVELEQMAEDEDITELKQLIEKHRQYTGSGVAENLLSHWESALSQFVKVMPVDYKRVLQDQKRELAQQAA
jgi:glutamate synthase domain-containing protein 3